MANIFPPNTNRRFYGGVALIALAAALALGGVYYVNFQIPEYEPVQPVRFSHKLHAGDLKMSCTACYTGEAVRWVMVNRLSGHAYFNHMAHLNRGIGCTSCHGDVAGMERISAPRDARMQWCLDCHRDPAPHLRPLEETASSHYSAADYLRTHSIRDGEGNSIQTPLQLGDFLKHQWKIQPRMDCTACHH